jgi:hypothetical protein
VQEFAVRNDMPCGSTIGPILAHNLGCRTVDVGMPQLSMHSIREMAGVDDVLFGYKHFREFFRFVACAPPVAFGMAQALCCFVHRHSHMRRIDKSSGI